MCSNLSYIEHQKKRWSLSAVKQSVLGRLGRPACSIETVHFSSTLQAFGTFSAKKSLDLVVNVQRVKLSEHRLAIDL